MLEKIPVPIFEEDVPKDNLFQHGGKLLYFHISVQVGLLGSKGSIGMCVHTGTTNQRHNNNQTRRVE